MVEVHGVEAYDGDGEHELEEAEHEAGESADEAAGGGFVAESVEERHVGWIRCVDKIWVRLVVCGLG